MSFDSFTEEMEMPINTLDNTWDPSSLKMVDKLNGLYDVSYIPTKQGTFYLHILLNDDHITGSPFIIEIEQDPYEEIKGLKREIERQVDFSLQLQEQNKNIKLQYATDVDELHIKLEQLVNNKLELEEKLKENENKIIDIDIEKKFRS